MLKLVLAALVAVLSAFAGLTDAEARRRTDTVWSEPAEVPFWEEGSTRRTKQARQNRQRYEADDEDSSSRRSRRSRTRTASYDDGGSASVGGRPSRWCGWYMRTRHGGGPEYNLARNWRNRGTPISGPQVGAIVVWNHHVGEIVGRADNGQWIVLSGNDGGRVRERARSVAGASFRML